MTQFKLAILISHPIQYHVPVFRALASHPEVDLTVFYCSDHSLREHEDPEFGVTFKWDIPLLEGYNAVFLKNRSGHPDPSFWGQINPEIWSRLHSHHYDAVLVHGYTGFTHWLSFAAARLSNTPLLLRGITHILDARPAGVKVAKWLVLPALFRSCAGCLFIGHHNKAYYQAYGVPNSQLFHVPHVVDNGFFQSARDQIVPQRDAVRKSFGIADDAPVVLFAGKLIEKKQPQWLLNAFRAVRERFPAHLLFVGEGNLRGNLESMIRKHKISDVHLAGFRNQSEMPLAYAAADLLVLPSRHGETWGLVVNEAMNFGLPIVVSDRVGCQDDLVRPNENGYVVNSEEELVTALTTLVSDPALRRRFGRRSLEIVNGWGIDQCVDGIVAALRATVRTHA